MNADRLFKLADLLDTVPPEHFDLGCWAMSLEVCETAGCAIGWATTIPEFRGAGWRLSERGRGLPIYESHEGLYEGWIAVQRFFRLSVREAEHLFAPWEYPAGNGTRPKIVANRIRKFVEKAQVAA